MSTRSLNKVMLIGNLTRDPELRYTPQGTAVCSFGLATNRSWVASDSTERKEEAEFHRIVAWNKLAELCSQLLTKGRKVYVEGRLQTRSWETPDGEKRQATEIVAEGMGLLDFPRDAGKEAEASAEGVSDSVVATPEVKTEPAPTTAPSSEPEQPKSEEAKKAETPEKIDVDDIPF